MPPPKLKDASPRRHIFAYVHLQTKQVLYSLTRILHNKALKQLPDLGANNTPAKLRKDLWQPLFTVTHPSTPSGARQTLNVYRRLCEWRKVHETCWIPPAALARPYTEKEIEAMQKKLDERGGSKKETVWDIIKRKKKKLRIHEVRDQKANSIADLAAVLLEEERLGVEKAEQLEQKLAKKRGEDVALVLQQAEAMQTRDGEEVMVTRIQTLQDELKAMRDNGTRGSRHRLTKDFSSAKRVLEQMRWSAVAVQKAREESKSARSGADGAEPDLEPFLPALPAIFDDLWIDAYTLKRERQEIERKRKLRHIDPFVQSMEDVKIQWANVLDPEFAEMWPAEVGHEPMGFLRHTAPDPVHDAAQHDVRVFKFGRKGADVTGQGDANLTGRGGQGLDGECRMVLQRQAEEMLRSLPFKYRAGLRWGMSHGAAETGRGDVAITPVQVPVNVSEQQGGKP